MVGVLLCLGLSQSVAQDSTLTQRFDSLAIGIPALNEPANISVKNIPLHDFIRVVGKTHGVNLFIDDIPGQFTTLIFTDEPVKNVLLFFCERYGYTIELIGEIIYFKPVAVLPAVRRPKEIRVSYQDSLLSFDLSNDSLQAVIKKISSLTGEIILPAPGVQGLLSGFIPRLSVREGIEKIFLINGFEVIQEEGIYYVSKEEEEVVNNTRPSGPRRPSRSRFPTPSTPEDLDLGYILSVTDTLISLQAQDAPLDELVPAILQEVGANYVIFDKLDGEISIDVQTLPLSQLLSIIFQGTSYTFKQASSVYQIGERTREGLWTSQIIKLKYRPTEQAMDLVPTKLIEAVELTEYTELNRIIISGDPVSVEEVAMFLYEIDRPIPMVRIEMLVIDVNINRLLNAGVRAGLRQNGDSSAVVKEVLPGINYDLSGSEINNLLGLTPIPFLQNIGPLRSNFYLQVQAQESQGNIRVITRPIISTINGEEANFTIGETQYFKLLTNTATAATVSPITQVTEKLQPIQYNTTLTVTPFISDGDMLTLQVAPNFTTPGAQTDPTIPPNVLTREFQSTIRMRNGETVILGGLSRESTSVSSDGVPLLSRIPVLRWLFGNTSRGRSESSLVIYITPTIYYY